MKREKESLSNDYISNKFKLKIALTQFKKFAFLMMFPPLHLEVCSITAALPSLFDFLYFCASQG